MAEKWGPPPLGVTLKKVGKKLYMHAREKFKSVKATRGRDPYYVTGEFRRVVVVVDGEDVGVLRGGHMTFAPPCESHLVAEAAIR